MRHVKRLINFPNKNLLAALLLVFGLPALSVAKAAPADDPAEPAKESALSRCVELQPPGSLWVESVVEACASQREQTPCVAKVGGALVDRGEISQLQKDSLQS